MRRSISSLRVRCRSSTDATRAVGTADGTRRGGRFTAVVPGVRRDLSLDPSDLLTQLLAKRLRVEVGITVVPGFGELGTGGRRRGRPDRLGEAQQVDIPIPSPLQSAPHERIDRLPIPLRLGHERAPSVLGMDRAFRLEVAIDGPGCVDVDPRELGELANAG